MEVRKRSAHALLERGLGDGLAERGRATGLLDAEAERTERGDHLLGRGLRPSPSLFCLALCLGLLPPRFRPTPRGFALPLHELDSERALGPILTVCPAPEADRRHGGSAATRHLFYVIKLE
jgi:hypothetical protein